MASSVGTALSRVLGLARELALANVLGAGMAMDAFVMAFTFPGMLRRFVADEGLTGALVPAIAKAEAEENEAAAIALSGRVLFALIVAGIALSGLGMAAAPWLVDWVADGFEGAKYNLTVNLTRALFPFVIFVSLVSWAEGLLNHRDHFFVPKIAPGLVSASVVAAVLIHQNDDPIAVVWAVTWAVLIGGFIHLVVCIPPLFKHWGPVYPRLDAMGDRRFQRVLGEMGKVAVIGVMAQVNTLVLRYIASQLEDGAVTWYWNATRLVDFAQGIIAVGVGSALLPAISSAVANKDGEGFREAFQTSIRLACVLLIPAAVFIAFFPTEVVAVLYRHGAYGWIDVEQTAITLAMLVPFMLALAGIQIIKKPFFALERRGALIGVGIVGVGLTTGLGLWLAPAMGVHGLALALSLSVSAQLIAYGWLLRRLVTGGLGLVSLLQPVLKMTAAALLGAAAAHFVMALGDWTAGPSLPNIGIFGSAGVIALFVYGIVAGALGVAEIRTVANKIARRLR
jgi:putative peptidoglycan lipid II flippase